MSVKPSHTLVVTLDLQYPSNDPAEHRYEIRCDGITDECRSWQECYGKECDSEALEKAELDGDDEPVAHGVPHRFIGNLGWSVEVPGCALALDDGWLDEARDLKLVPGSYRFIHQWEDGGEWFSMCLVDAGAA